ncbi:MAG TPA: rRNA maturation RNase YbeY [Gemmatimonadaceae bacterium]
MAESRIVTEVSSTVRRLNITPATVKQLVELTLKGEHITNAMISVAFVGETAIARMNEQYLGHSGPTDVISFGMGRNAPGLPAIGDIYICPSVARRNARANSVSERQELARLVVHGALHVAGYDHPEDETRTSSTMWKRQEKILARAG